MRFVGRFDEFDATKFTYTYKMRLPLPPGRYNCVVWGGLNPDHYYGCMQGEEKDTASMPVVSTTALEDMLIRIDCEVEQLGGTTNHNVDYMPTPLFYGNSMNLDLDASSGEQVVVIDLMKNSNQIRVNIEGLDMLLSRANPYPGIDFRLSSPNGAYGFHNEFETNCRTYTYLPQDMTRAGGKLTMDFHTLRMLFDNGHAFTINDSRGDALFSADLLEDYIRKVEQYSTQQAVDEEDFFEINISINSNLGVSVTVNGWDVTGKGSEIQ